MTYYGHKKSRNLIMVSGFFVALIRRQLLLFFNLAKINLLNYLAN